MKKNIFMLLTAGVIVATSVSCTKDEKKEPKKTEQVSQPSDSHSDDSPTNLHFPNPGKYIWKQEYGLRDFLTFNKGQDSIRFHRSYFSAYSHIINKVSFSEEDGKWIGIAGKSYETMAPETEGKYVVLFFKDIKKNSVQVIRKVFNTQVEADEFVIPANPEWGDYQRE